MHPFQVIGSPEFKRLVASGNYRISVNSRTLFLATHHMSFVGINFSAIKRFYCNGITLSFNSNKFAISCHYNISYLHSSIF